MKMFSDRSGKSFQHSRYSHCLPVMQLRVLLGREKTPFHAATLFLLLGACFAEFREGWMRSRCN